jgi:hypothetical protein
MESSQSLKARFFPSSGNLNGRCKENEVLKDTSTNQGAKYAHLVSAYQGPLGNNSLNYIDFRQRNLHNL